MAGTRALLCLLLLASSAGAQRAWMDGGSEPQTQTELEGAFEDDQPPPARRASLLDGAPPPRAAAKAADEPRSPEESALLEVLSEAKKALTEGRLDDAASFVRDVAHRTRGVSPKLAQDAFELGVKIARTHDDERSARRLSQLWLLACGPEQVKTCRHHALAALDATTGAGAEGVHHEVQSIEKSDACLEEAEAQTGRRPPACVSAALATYRHLGDKLMIARAMLVEALVKVDPDADHRSIIALLPVTRACAEPRCAEVMRRPWHELVPLYLDAGDADSAARSAIREMEWKVQTEPAAQRPYGRTPDVDRACAELDAKSGPGTCRRLERSMLGRLSFHDLSKRSLPGTGLPAEEIRKVNDEFSVTLQDCLTEAAKRMSRFDRQTVRVSWTVLNDGRVDSPKVDRKDDDAGPLGACLRERFTLWRYPKYRGEWQHVEQEFTLETR